MPSAASHYPRSDRSWIFLAAAVIGAAAWAAYAGSFSAPFVFDSNLVVVNNPTIRHLATALQPPHNGSTVEGRPLVNLSLALNYALSGTRVGSYHAFNLAVHILCGWTLLGVVRRTLPGPGRRRLAVAFAAALLWTVHPLQTESVTYVAQRAEALAALFYLLTLYGFIRGLSGGRLWSALSFLSCLAGVYTKETVVSAPVVALLYDRTFVSGSFAEAWRRHKAIFLALAATWIPLAFLVLGAANRSGTAGLGTDFPWLRYIQVQVYAVPHYLRLALWPTPLVFDYGRAAVELGPAWLFSLALLAVLVIGTGVAVCAREPVTRGLGFLGAWFFAILAPTCLIPVATQTMAEHRMYLPLAALTVGGALLLARSGLRPLGLVAVSGLIATGLAAGTLARNRAYRSELSLWSDTVAKRPGNDRAYNNLGNAYFVAGRIPEAVASYEQALRLHPVGNADAEYNLGNGYLAEGRLPEAIVHSRNAIRFAPANPEAHNNLGMALDRSGDARAAAREFQEAIGLYRAFLQGDPADARMVNGIAIACYNLGNALAKAGQMEGAIGQYRQALEFKPDLPEAQLNWGNALFQEAKFAEAAAHYREALRLRPDFPQAQYILKVTLQRQRR